jgi:hypothetical protein
MLWDINDLFEAWRGLLLDFQSSLPVKATASNMRTHAPLCVLLSRSDLMQPSRVGSFPWRDVMPLRKGGGHPGCRRSCGLTLSEAGGPQRLALMSRLRHDNNIPSEGHFSAHGKPNRACVMSVRAVQRGDDTRTRPHSPSHAPGDCGLVSTVRSRPQHGTGEFRRSSRGPQRVEGWEMRRGQ